MRVLAACACRPPVEGLRRRGVAPPEAAAGPPDRARVSLKVYCTLSAVSTLSTLSLVTSEHAGVDDLRDRAAAVGSRQARRLQLVGLVVVQHLHRVVDEELAVLHDDAVDPALLRGLEEVRRLLHRGHLDVAGVLAGLAQRRDDAGARFGVEAGEAGDVGMRGEDGGRHLRRLLRVAAVVLVGDDLVFAAAIGLEVGVEARDALAHVAGVDDRHHGRSCRRSAASPSSSSPGRRRPASRSCRYRRDGPSPAGRRRRRRSARPAPCSA